MDDSTKILFLEQEVRLLKESVDQLYSTVKFNEGMVDDLYMMIKNNPRLNDVHEHFKANYAQICAASKARRKDSIRQMLIHDSNSNGQIINIAQLRSITNNVE